MLTNNAKNLRSWMAQKKHFIWDFDGSLCNTERSHFEAYRRAFAEFGHLLLEDNYYLDFTHLGEGAQKEILKSGIQASLEDVLKRKKQHFDQIISHEEIADFVETESILKWMKNRGTISIASNSTAPEINIILSRKKIECYVDFVVGKSEGLRKKPFPDLFLEAHRRLHSPQPATVVVFEDSERGLQAAAHAGFESVLLITEFNSNLEFNAPYAAKMTHSELLELVTA